VAALWIPSLLLDKDKKRHLLFHPYHQKHQHCLPKTSLGLPAPSVGHVALATSVIASTAVNR